MLFGEVTSSVKWRYRQRVPPPLETLRAVHLEGVQQAVYMNTWCCVVFLLEYWRRFCREACSAPLREARTPAGVGSSAWWADDCSAHRLTGPSELAPPAVPWLTQEEPRAGTPSEGGGSST